MAGGYLGIREIKKDVWPSSTERGGVFPNFRRSSSPTVRPDGTALEVGDLYYHDTDNILYAYTSGAAWSSVGTIAAATLNTVYQNGQTITRDQGTIAITDSLATATDTLSISKTGAGSADLINLTTTTSWSGDAIGIDMSNAAVGAQAVVIVGQSAARTGNGLIYITENGTGAVPTLRISGDAATTGPLLSLIATAAVAPVANTNGIATLNMSNAAAATQGLLIIGPAAARTGAAIRITDAGTSTGSALSIACSSTSSASVIAFSTSGAITGDAINLNMANAGTAAQALVITGQTATRITNPLIEIIESGDGALPTVNIAGAGATTGALLRLNASAAVAPVADTDGMMTINTTSSANAAQGLLVYNNTAAHTGSLIRVYDNAGTGAGTGISVAYGAASTGDALNITMTNAGTAAQAAVIVGQAAVRITNPLIAITENGTGAVPTVDILGAAASTGSLLRVRASAAVAPVAGTDGMVTINTANAAAATEALLIEHAAASTGSALRIDTASTALAASPLIDVNVASIFTGSIMQLAISAAVTGAGIDIDISDALAGNLVDIDVTTANVPTTDLIAVDFGAGAVFNSDVIQITLTNCNTAARAINIVGQAGAATSDLISVTVNGTGAGHSGLNITGGGVVAGSLIELAASAAMTGNMLTVTMTNADAAADGVVLDGGTLTGRTGNLLQLLDAQTTGSGASIAVTKSGALAVGDVFDITCSSTGAGAVFDIDLTAAYTGIVFDIDGSVGVHTGNIFDFATTQAYAGDVFRINLTNCAAAVQLFNVTGSATTRTAHLIEIAEVGTPSGDVINISHGGASTGDGIHMDMTNATAARSLNLDGVGVRTVNLIDIDCSGADTAAAIDITTAGVGASTVGAALNISCSGTLADGAAVVRIYQSGSTTAGGANSHTLSVVQDTGAGTAGDYALYVSATGASVEGLRVDDGDAVFDEDVTITGNWLSGTPENIAAGTGGAINVTQLVTTINTDAGGDSFTLANGAVGQLKTIVMLADGGGNATVTPATALGFTSWTGADVGDTVTLVYTASGWAIVSNYSGTIS